MPKLQIADENEQYVYEIFDDEVSIGRGAANAVQVADSHASKHHAVLRRIRGHWKLIDLESSNGTRVNDEFRNQHWLSDGDAVSIGTSVLRYEADGAPQGPPEVAAARAVKPGVVAAKPAAVAPRAVPAKPVAAKPAAVAPAAPAAAPQQLAESPVEAEPQVAPVTPAAPSRSRPGAPARARARTRQRYEDDYDYEDGGRPRREPRKDNSIWIGVGIAAGLIVFVLLILAIFDQSLSHNREVLYQGRLLADKQKYVEAVEYAERNGRPDELDYDKLQTGIQDWKIRLEASRQLRRNTAAQSYWKREIQYKAYSETKSTTTTPVDRLPDEEIVVRIRKFLKENWDTAIVRTFLGSEHDVFPYFRELLRQHADESYSAGRAWAEVQDDVTAFTGLQQWGRAVRRLKVHAQIGRLTMLPEAWKKLESQVSNEVASIEGRAADELVDEVNHVDKLMAEGERDTATQQVRVLASRFRGIPRLYEQVLSLRQKHNLKH